MMEREQAFDDDYLYFYAQLLTDERSEQEVDLIWRLLELEAGLTLLDLACGHGRIANRLAERGVHVTGLDATPRFLELARHRESVSQFRQNATTTPWGAQTQPRNRIRSICRKIE